MKEEKRIGRRDFLKSGVAGAFGGGIYLGSAGIVPGADKNKKKKEPVIEYRKLGNIDYKASLIGFGAVIPVDGQVNLDVPKWDVHLVLEPGYDRARFPDVAHVQGLPLGDPSGDDIGGPPIELDSFVVQVSGHPLFYLGADRHHG